MAPSLPGRPSGRFTQHRRLEKLSELLQRHPSGLTLYQLADQLGVTPRTMRRYLREVGDDLALEPARRRAGGAMLWRIRAGELPRKVELRRTQAYAWLAARKIFEPLRGSALYDEIDLAIQKLMAFAQRPGRGPNAGLADARLEERFLYRPFAPKVYADKTDELDDLFQAVSDLRPLSLLYKSLGKEKDERITIHPYALVLHRDSIYCVGYHVARGEVRTFLLDRMRDTHTAATERFELPSDFSVDAYFADELGVWRSDERHDVVIDFAPSVAHAIRARRLHSTQKLSPLPGGGVRLSLTVGDLRQLTSWILEWGQTARAVAPPALVEAVTTELRGALGAYGTAPPRTAAARPAAPRPATRRPAAGRARAARAPEPRTPGPRSAATRAEKGPSATRGAKTGSSAAGSGAKGGSATRGARREKSVEGK